MKRINHPLFVRADLKLEEFRRHWEPKNPYSGSKVDTNIVWQYWDTGWRDAPQVAKFCSQVSEATLGDFRFQRLSSSDVAEMGIIATPLLNLLEKGQISKAGFADVVRFRLVEHFGGYWLDATALAVAPWKISRSEILSYGRSGSVPGRFWFNNWYLGGSELGGYFGRCADLLESYWLTKGGQQHYFDAFFAMKRLALDLGTPKSDQVSSIQIQPATALMRGLRKDLPRAELILKLHASPLHKLSHKSVDEQRVIAVIRDLLDESRI